MANTFINGRNTPLNQVLGNVPNVSGALLSWFQPMRFDLIVKTTEAFQVVETTTPINFRGVIQPLTDRQLSLRPEGQRAWSWFQLHSTPNLKLEVDDVVIYLGVQTRVMALKDYSLYGYVEYHLCQDWTGSGPTVVTP